LFLFVAHAAALGGEKALMRKPIRKIKTAVDKPVSDESQVNTYVVKGSEAEISVQMMGEPHKVWWGTEHMAPVIHAAKFAEHRNQPCVVIEAGAHQGGVAILAAKLGCEVYAYEMQAAHVTAFKKNVALNGISEGRIHIFQEAIGKKPNQRIDETFPKGKHVTLLKMDIDGPDADAMIGASGVFAEGGVDFVNLEFNPKKQGVNHEYLANMAALGFNMYVLDCYPRSDDYATVQSKLGPVCLRTNKIDPHGYNIEPKETEFLSCSMQGNCKSKDVDVRQKIEESKIPEFVTALQANQGEVDMLLRNRNIHF